MNRLARIVLIALLPLIATQAQALTVTNVGGDTYQIDFKPIDFKATLSGPGLGFIVKDYFVSAGSADGLSSSGTFMADINGVPYSNSFTGSVRGPVSFSLGIVSSTDLLVLIGDFPAFGVVNGDPVQVSGDALQFTFPGTLSAVAAGPYDAILVGAGMSGFVELSDPVKIAVPLPAALPLLAGGLVGLGLLRRRRRAHR